MRDSSDVTVTKLIAQVIAYRNQEQGHEAWLKAEIRSLGGDAHAEN